MPPWLDYFLLLNCQDYRYPPMLPTSVGINLYRPEKYLVLPAKAPNDPPSEAIGVGGSEERRRVKAIYFMI